MRQYGSLAGIRPNSIHNMDCIKGMAQMRASSVDLVITDPPFAIGFGRSKANYNRKGSRVMRGYGEVPKEKYAEFTAQWMQQACRVLKESGSMYVFSGWNNLRDILAGLDASGLEVINHIIWKYQFGVVTRRKFVTSHYHCLYACKDDSKRKFYPYSRYGKDERKDGRSMHYMDKEDVWVIKREYWTGDAKTPTKLPRALIEKILAYSSDKGDLVLDPFLGSGQVAITSKEAGRRYCGFELVPEYYGFAKRRLETGQYRIRA